MSRSFNNGTPSWAKVETRPVNRRDGEVVKRLLKEFAIEENQRLVEEAKLDAMYQHTIDMMYSSREEREMFYDVYEDMYEEDPEYADDWADRHEDTYFDAYFDAE